MNTFASSVVTGCPPLRIVLGPDGSGVFDAGVPVLAGEAEERLFAAATPVAGGGAFALFATGGWRLGAATVAVPAGLEEAAHRLYAELLQVAAGRHLARIWNYVPAINAAGTDGLEGYRHFCRGRSLAFERHFGAGFKARLPAASAVGRAVPGLTVVFAACERPPRHVENPLQLPAYDYPGDYGPRAPSFARATVVPGGAGSTVFISGTAAIRGHVTVAPHRLAEQLACTLENLRGISAACGLGTELDGGGASRRHFKVYLRHAADQPGAAAILEPALRRERDRFTYLRADLCRAPLRVEIEASLFGVTVRRRDGEQAQVAG